MKALKIRFEKSEVDDYNSEFVANIKEKYKKLFDELKATNCTNSHK